jgi:uncharacterized protein (DUF58 family)
VNFFEWYAGLEKDIALSSRAVVTTVDPGDHRTIFTGKGFRVRHHAEYRPGDDRRLIDWKMSLKVGDLLVKRFAQEGQLTVIAAGDVSPSMAFGTRDAKRDLMLRILGVLGLATVQQLDRFEVVLFSDRVEREFRAVQGRTAIVRLLEELWEAPPLPPRPTPTRLVPVLARIALKPRALVFLVSDFQCEENWVPMYEAAAVKHDLVPVLVRDAGETHLPALGVVTVRDLESGEEFALDTGSRAWREQFETRAAAAERARIELFERGGGDYLVVSPDSDFIGDLLHTFHDRKRR